MYIIPRPILQTLLVICCFLTITSLSTAQTPTWGFNIGDNGNDMSRVCKVAPNGNVCMAGKFRGTIDLDPDAGTHYVTSNGQDDIFLACYSRSGGFLWGFSIGGANYDGAWYMTIDGSNNVIICGYFQSAGIDFDPGAGTTTLSYAGGTGIPYYGDGFVAKYSPSGAFQWAKSLGGNTVNDVAVSLATDNTGNVYVGGAFFGSMTVSGSLTLSSTADGSAYLLKYNTTGTLVWGHNYGEPTTAGGNNDCFPRSIQVSNGNIYVGGFFHGTANFNPWGASSYLTSVGSYDAYIARYDTGGNFAFVKQISGTGSNDEVLALALDSVNNIYVSGYTSSATMTFDPSSAGTSTFSSPGASSGNFDLWMARYDSAGNYAWGQILGSTGNEFGYNIDVSGNSLYCSGSFEHTVDFDPSTAVSSLTSTGGADVFVTKYSLNGNYICGFGVGNAATDDIGFGMAHTNAGFMYLSGQFGGSGIDFDPGATSLALTSYGGTDAFLVKYDWINDTLLSGYLTGDSICQGQTAYLTLHVTSGSSSSYSVTIHSSAGATTYTGVTSGVPFALSSSPSSTATYSAISVIPAGASLCTLPPGGVFGTATVTVHSIMATISDSVVNCGVVAFMGNPGDSTYMWTFGDGTSSTLRSVTHTYLDTGMNQVVLLVYDSTGCSASDTISLHVTAPIIVSLGPDTAICTAGTVNLHSSISYPSGATYIWSNGSASSSINISSSNTYWLKVTEGTCSGTDTVKIKIKPSPVVHLGNDTTYCNGNFLQNTYAEPAGSTYKWSTGATATGIFISAAGTYWLTVSDSGCIASDTININVVAAPGVNLGPDVSVCSGTPVLLQSSINVSSAVYLWNTGATSASLSPTTSGIYWLKVTKNGCSTADSVLVTIKPYPTVNLGGDLTICSGSLATLSATEPAGAQFVWSNGYTSSSISVTKSGVYSLIVTLDSCASTDSVQVSVIQAPKIDLGPDTTVCDGFIIDLAIHSEQANYIWSTGATDSNIIVNQSGIYWATVSNICGVATDTVEINHDFCNIWFPNAFTPNGDGKNEIIRVRGNLDNYKDFRFSVFNRWGELVFLTQDAYAGWDGYFKGVPQETGTYFYMVLYTLYGKKLILKGDFELIR